MHIVDPVNQTTIRLTTTLRVCTLVNSRDIIRAIEEDGWRLDRVKGSHHQFRHPTKPGTVTVRHPDKDVPVGTLKGIERQSGLVIR